MQKSIAKQETAEAKQAAQFRTKKDGSNHVSQAKAVDSQLELIDVDSELMSSHGSNGNVFDSKISGSKDATPGLGSRIIRVSEKQESADYHSQLHEKQSHSQQQKSSKSDTDLHQPYHKSKVSNTRHESPAESSNAHLQPPQNTPYHQHAEKRYESPPPAFNLISPRNVSPPGFLESPAAKQAVFNPPAQGPQYPKQVPHSDMAISHQNPSATVLPASTTALRSEPNYAVIYY
jgi:hypothetical protein